MILFSKESRAEGSDKSSCSASCLSSSKGVANDFGKTGKRSSMNAQLKEEKSSTPIIASVVLARTQNPATRGSPVTFLFPNHSTGSKEWMHAISLLFCKPGRNGIGRQSQKFN